MKHIKLVLKSLAVILTVAGLTACSSDNPKGGSGKSIKMNRLNIEKAQYLTLGTSDGSRASTYESLFKVDENGNTSVVMLECAEAEDGTITNKTYNLEVQPRNIYNLTQSWMYLFDCNFYCAESQDIVWQMTDQYTRPSGSFYFNILANKKTGKVYFVPDDYGQYFYSTASYDGDLTQFFAEDGAGTLYSATQDLVKITVTPEGAVINFLSPPTHRIGGSTPYPLSNGTVVLIPAPYQIQAVFPNGGFEDIYYSSMSEPGNPIYGTDLRVEGIFHYSDNIFYMVLTNWVNDEVTVELRTLSVENAYGSISMSEPTLTHPYTTGNVVPLYVGDKYVIFGDHLAYDKITGGWIEIGEGSETAFITPTDKNIYQGRAWHAYSDAIDWMDLNTLETGRIWYDFPSGLQYDNYVPYITNGEVFVYATDRSDGKSYVYRIDITTGQSTRSEIAYESTSVTLIPLN